MRNIIFEILDDNGFAQPLYYRLENEVRGISYFYLTPNHNNGSILVYAEQGGLHSIGTPSSVINREKYRFDVPSAISRYALSRLSEPTNKFYKLANHLVDEHLAENFGACDVLVSQIEELLSECDQEFPDSIETIWEDETLLVDCSIHITTPDLPTVCITAETSDSELEEFATKLEKSIIWLSRENFVTDTTYDYLVSKRDDLIEIAEEIDS
jgi:hypothetical protein